MSPQNIARPEIVMDISSHIWPGLEPGKVKARLTGYVSLQSVSDGAKSTCSHFISVTQSRITDHFFLLDDLSPGLPRDLGTHVHSGWPVPTWLFYDIERGEHSNKGEDKGRAKSSGEQEDKQSENEEISSDKERRRLVAKIPQEQSQV